MSDLTSGSVADTKIEITEVIKSETAEIVVWTRLAEANHFTTRAIEVCSQR